MPFPPLPAQRIGFARTSVPADLPPRAGLRPRRELSAGGCRGVCGGDPSLGRRLDVPEFLFLTVTSYRGDICLLRARFLKMLENSGDKPSFSEAYT